MLSLTVGRQAYTISLLVSCEEEKGVILCAWATASSRATPSRTPARGSSLHCRERTRLSTGLEAHLLIVASFDIDSRDSLCGFVCRLGCLVETRFPRRRGAHVWLFIKVGL